MCSTAAERAHNCNNYMYVMVLVVMIQHTTELHTYMYRYYVHFYMYRYYVHFYMYRYYVHVCICNENICTVEDVVSE